MSSFGRPARRYWIFFGSLLAAETLWMVSGWLVVPRMITDAYFDRSLPTLNDLIAASRHPLEYYLQYWDPIADAGVGVIAALGLFAGILLSPRYSQRLVKPASPEALGAIRILVCSVLFMMCVWEDLGSSAALPRGLIRPMGLLDLFYALPLGFEWFVASCTALVIFQWATAVLLLLGAAGWRARITVLAGGLCYLVMAGIFRQYAWFYHTGLVPAYVAVWLACTPCGDGWSLDRWLRRRRGERVAPDNLPAAAYGWARYGCWLLIALPYVAAGMSKLRNGGWMWWDATNFRHILFRGTMNPMHFEFELSLALVSVPDVVVEILALSALFGELLFGLVLFFRSARLVLPLVMVGMHVGILFLQNILFLDLILLQASFFNLVGLARKARAFAGGNLSMRGLLCGLREDQSSEAGAAFEQGRHLPYLLIAVTSVLLLSWLGRLEFYPFTSMQMASVRETSGVLPYNRVFAHYDDGEVVRAPIEECFPALVDARYRRVLDLSWDEARQSLCAEFFRTCGRRLNTVAREGRRVTQFEVQRWEWAFEDLQQRETNGRMVGQRLFAAD